MRATLAYVLEGAFRLLHPLMPFLTEELWQRVPRPASRGVSVAFGPYPTKEAEAAHRDARRPTAWMALLQAGHLGRADDPQRARDRREATGRPSSRCAILSESPQVRAFLSEHAGAIRLLVRTKGDPVLEAPGGPRAPGPTPSVVPSTHGPIEVLVLLKGLVDQAHEMARIDREKKKVEKEIAVIDKKLGSPGFVDRAPKEVVEETKAQRAALVAAVQRLAEARTLAAEL